MSFFSSIPLWGWFDIGFTFVVLASLCGETNRVAKWFIKDHSNELLPVEFKRQKFKKRAELLLILGIAGELACLPFSLIESAQTNELASDANERAAITESNNLVMQKELQPRRITMEQRKYFMLLTQFVPKIPIKIVIGSEGFDTEDFADDMREMLMSAGFKTNSDAEYWGVNRKPWLLFRKKLWKTNDSDVVFVAYSTNKWGVYYLNFSVETLTNKMLMSACKNDDFDVYGAIDTCFQRIGLKTEWMGDSNYVKSNECFIFIPVRK